MVLLSMGIALGASSLWKKSGMMLDEREGLSSPLLPATSRLSTTASTEQVDTPHNQTYRRSLQERVKHMAHER